MRFIFAFLFLFGLSGQEFAPRVVRTMAELRALTPSATKPLVEVLGYYQQGDGGGGMYILTNTVVGTNAYGGRVLTLKGTNSWELKDDGYVNAKQFGVQGGFDGVTATGPDDTDEIQAAMDWASANGYLPVIVPAGSYSWKSLETKGSPLIGAGGQTPRGASTTVYHRLGATNDLVWNSGDATWVSGNTRPPIRVEGFRMYGAMEGNRKSPKVITGVSSRTVFAVDPGDAPTAGPNVAAFPFYGYCFFFSTEGRYLGSGVVLSVSGGTITLDNNSDLYSTVSPDTMLTEGQYVCFSDLTTSTSGFVGSTTSADPTKAGYSGIRLGQAGGEGAILRDLYIRNFLTGVSLDQTAKVTIEDCWFGANAFAGASLQHYGRLYDAVVSKTICQGFYAQDYTWAGDSPSQTILNPTYRRTAIGWNGLGGSGHYDHLTIDACVIGIFSLDDVWNVLSYLNVDQPVWQGIRSRGQPIANVPNIVTSGFFRSSVNSVVTNGPAATRPSAVNISGQNGNWAFGQLSVVELNSGSPFSSVFNLAGTGSRVALGHLVATNGADAVLASTSIGQLVMPLMQQGTNILTTNTWNGRQYYSDGVTLATGNAIRFNTGAEAIVHLSGQVRFNAASATIGYFGSSGLLPGATTTYDLGSSGARWNQVHAQEVTLRGASQIAGGTGSPEGSASRVPGSVYLQTDVTAGSVGLWAKMSGSGNTGWVPVYSGAPATFSSDIGDANVTLTGSSPFINYYLTPLTANRTVIFTTNAMFLGQRFRIVREGLGSFTLDVGGLKTIPSATAATVEVQYIGSGMKLVQYGTN